MCRCRPTSSTATRPMTPGATRPSSPGTPARWPRRPRRCTSTRRLLAQLDARGIERASVTLHVGAGTFQPVKTENIAEHRMHSEWYDVPRADAGTPSPPRARAAAGWSPWARPRCARSNPGRATGQASGDTSIFITPGFEFRVVDRLVTNFHLPRSTLLMLVSAFAGYDHIMDLYRHAIAQRYRFFSYGDAMLLARTA